MHIGDYITRYKELIGGWGKELTLSVFLDPRVKDFAFIKDSKEREELIERARGFAAAEIKPTGLHINRSGLQRMRKKEEEKEEENEDTSMGNGDLGQGEEGIELSDSPCALEEAYNAFYGDCGANCG